MMVYRAHKREITMICFRNGGVLKSSAFWQVLIGHSNPDLLHGGKSGYGGESCERRRECDPIEKVML